MAGDATDNSGEMAADAEEGLNDNDEKDSDRNQPEVDAGMDDVEDTSKAEGVEEENGDEEKAGGEEGEDDNEEGEGVDGEDSPVESVKEVEPKPPERDMTEEHMEWLLSSRIIRVAVTPHSPEDENATEKEDEKTEGSSEIFPSNQQRGLIAVKQKFDGELNWVEKNVLGEFNGVTTNRRGFVESLELLNKFCMGSMLDLFELRACFTTHLLKLILPKKSIVNFTGDVAVLECCKSLQVIDLCENMISGDIRVFQDFKSLRDVNLFGCKQIAGDISSFSGSETIEALSLGHTNVEGDISVLKDLQCLLSLHLESCNVSGDVKVLQDMNNLRQLNLLFCYKVTGDREDFEHSMPKCAKLTSLPKKRWLSTKTIKDTSIIFKFDEVLNAEIDAEQREQVADTDMKPDDVPDKGPAPSDDGEGAEPAKVEETWPKVIQAGSFTFTITEELSKEIDSLQTTPPFDENKGDEDEGKIEKEI